MNLPTIIKIRNLLKFQILFILNKKKLCGDGLAENIGKKRKNKLTPGTIYPALKFLRKNKLIKFKRSGRKKIYYLTDKGKKELKSCVKVFKKLFEDQIKRRK